MDGRRSSVSETPAASAFRVSLRALIGLVFIIGCLCGGAVSYARLRAAEAAYRDAKLIREISEIAVTEYIQGVRRIPCVEVAELIKGVRRVPCRAPAPEPRTIAELKRDLEKARADERDKKAAFERLRWW